MLFYYIVMIAIVSITSVMQVSAFRPSVRFGGALSSTKINMGFMDALNKALANDPNLPPAVNPGGKVPDPVLVEFLPSKKQIKAYPGQKLSMIASTAGEKIKYSCKKGECATCEVSFNGKVVKACQATLPSTGKTAKYVITIPQK